MSDPFRVLEEWAKYAFDTEPMTYDELVDALNQLAIDDKLVKIDGSGSISELPKDAVYYLTHTNPESSKPGYVTIEYCWRDDNANL